MAMARRAAVLPTRLPLGFCLIVLYPSKTMDTVAPRTLYEADELAWIEVQIAALQSGDLDRLDRAHLIECLTDLAKRERRELQSRLVVLAAHVLKCHIQPPPSRSWRLTILEQQRMVGAILHDYPSLAAQADTLLREAYPHAVKAALVETGLDGGIIPPWIPSVADLLQFDAS
jgi:hypothetical protein